MPSLATAEQQGGGSAISLLIPLMLIVFIGLMFWQQRRRTKQMQQAQSELNVGDPVSTTSGLMGRLVQLTDDAAVIEAAPGVQLRFDRRAVLPARIATDQQGQNAPSSEPEQGARPADTDDPAGDDRRRED